MTRSNNLTDLPDDLFELRHVRILRLKYNQLKRLPSTVTRLPQLVTLELSGNQITRLDSNVSHVRDYCSDSQPKSVIGVHMAVGGHKHPAQTAELSKNICAMVNSLPESQQPASQQLTWIVLGFLQMTQLKELDVSGNLLTELPLAMATLPKLEVSLGPAADF